MSEFSLYFGLGKDHILDYANGYDHILFVVALCALYVSRDWRRVLILVTAFTIGHSITLTLSSLKIINVNPDLIEFLSPGRYYYRCLNLLRRKLRCSKPMQINYLYAAIFG